MPDDLPLSACQESSRGGLGSLDAYFNLRLAFDLLDLTAMTLPNPLLHSMVYHPSRM